MAPIPIGDSRAVQKWNWWGVEGLSSVATTRPTGGVSEGMDGFYKGEGEAVSGEQSLRRSRLRFEALFDGVHAVEEAITALVRSTDRTPLGQDPAGDPVGHV